MPKHAAYCETCGTEPPIAARARRAAAPAHPQAKSRPAAGLLGIFLGHMGIHRFYLGYVGIGILQIVLTICTCGVGGLWGFIEGIVIMAGGVATDAKGIPLRD